MTAVSQSQQDTTDPIGSTVLRDLTDGVLTITLNRPEAANAIRADQRNALISLFTEADGDPDVRVVVLAADGKHFCSGADVGGIGGGGEKRVGDPMRKIMGGAQRLVTSILDCGKPVIASVQGVAAGMGAHLAYAADLVVASEQASFIESFVLRGLVVDAGGAYLLPRRIGLQKAKELAFFGDRLPAAEALALGLVNKVVPADELAAATAEYAARLATAPTSAIALTKKLFNTSLDVSREAAFLDEGMAQEIQSYAADSGEGVAAFKERRSPDYRGW
ncbi:enoyl-CoA hydratase/isomerase family protein [uncultured Modestobacter sp.]|uniref:enoyl-CoA hydratase/isomerase family protein n=1 Tax=uncultured Modestobacter sp. TaxID=380048 RepID=UPI002626CA92|nr:enoyl-CoA hydratase-related protein [uncultured Modestobacter sp.]